MNESLTGSWDRSRAQPLSQLVPSERTFGSERGLNQLDRLLGLGN